MTKTIAGRPVTGEIPFRSRSARVEQKPIEGFVAWLDTVLAVPGVESVKWSQHTPSWNDGDVCEFGVGEVYVRIAGDDPEAGDYENGFRDSYDVEDLAPDAAKAMNALTWQDTKSYYHALEQAFGDPAEIVATKDGFSVDYYESD